MTTKSPFIQLHPGTWVYRPGGERRKDELRIVLPEDKATFRVIAIGVDGFFTKVTQTNFRSRKAAEKWVLANVK
jgi:hypothetical protein